MSRPYNSSNNKSKNRLLYGIESKTQVMKIIIPNLLQCFNIYFSSVCMKRRSLLLTHKINKWSPMEYWWNDTDRV